MREVLTRNFIANMDLDTYLKVLKNKIQYLDYKVEENELENLFNILKFYNNNNPQYYTEIMEKLQNFTEDFVIRNSNYIKCLIQLEKEERQIILLKFNDFNYNDDLNIIDLLKKIENELEESIKKYIDECIFNENYSIEKLKIIAVNFKSRENKQFIGTILDNLLEKYPIINEYSIFSQMFVKLNQNIGIIAYKYIQKEIINKENEFRKYHRIIIEQNTLKRIKRTIYNPKKLK